MNPIHVTLYPTAKIAHCVRLDEIVLEFGSCDQLALGLVGIELLSPTEATIPQLVAIGKLFPDSTSENADKKSA